MHPSPTVTGALRTISVIIANHDYEAYVGRAIDSALALEWDDVEVIVVDDGSTDGSREVIAGYGDRITAVYQDNATQRVARNRGYALCRGDVVIHLDSDDVLYPGLARELARVWRPGVSKVQFQMVRIDVEDKQYGAPFPRFERVPSPATVRRWVHRTGAYPTPPGSGNAYSREFLDRIFPLDDSCGPATDSACLAAAPVLGDVLTVKQPLVGYRVHGANVSDLTADDERFVRTVERARQRYRYVRRLAGDTDPVPDERALRRGRELLQLRIATHRLFPGRRVFPGDSAGRLLVDVLRSPFQPGADGLRVRAIVFVWGLLTWSAPDRLARRLVRLRYDRRR